MDLVILDDRHVQMEFVQERPNKVIFSRIQERIGRN